MVAGVVAKLVKTLGVPCGGVAPSTNRIGDVGMLETCAYWV
jgi:hypothetical protein